MQEHTAEVRAGVAFLTTRMQHRQLDNWLVNWLVSDSHASKWDRLFATDLAVVLLLQYPYYMLGCLKLPRIEFHLCRTLSRLGLYVSIVSIVLF